MKKKSHIACLFRSFGLFIGVAALSVAFPGRGAADDPLDAVIERTGKQVSSFLDLISEMNCTERVLQEQLAENGKVIEKQESTFDYLIILSTSGGELSLVESRIAPQDAKQQKKTRDV